MLRVSNRWAMLGLIVLGRILVGFQFQSIPPMAAIIIEEMSLNSTQLGLLVGIYMLPGILLSLPSGLLSARFGDRILVLVGLTLMTLGGILLVNSSAFPMALFARLLAGVGAILLNVQLMKVVADWFAGKEITTAMAVFGAAFPAGISLSVSFMGLVAINYSWQVAVAITAAASVFTLALYLVSFTNDHPGEDTPTQPAPGGGAVGEGMSRLWRMSNRELGLVSAASLVLTVYTSAYMVFLSYTPLLLTHNGYSVATAGGLVSITTWMVVVSPPLGGLLIDRWGRAELVMVVSTLIASFAISMMTLGQAIWVFAAVFGLFGGAPMGAIMALPSQVLSPKSRATGFGVYFTIYFAGIGGFPPLAGMIVDYTGRLEFAGFFAAILLLSTGGFLLLFRQLQARMPSPQ